MDEYYAEVSEVILKQYDDELGIVVLQKLAGVLKNLRYSTLFQSVAIFVSPVFQKVFYLRFQVSPYVHVGDDFSIREVLAQKRKINRMMVLSLFPGKASLYLFSSGKLLLMKEDISAAAENSYRQLDKELKWLLDAYSLPVIAAGGKEQLSAFQKVTQNARLVVKYVPLDPGFSNHPDNLLQAIHCYTSNREEIRRAFLQKDLAFARRNGKLAFGFESIGDAVYKQRALRLYIRSSFLRHYEQGSESFDSSDPDRFYNRFSYVKNSLEDIIAEALESDADVEVVDDDFLDDYQNIVLVKK